MVAITALKPGDIVYDVVSQRMGNTRVRRKAVYDVRIVEVAEDHSYVMASWNGNPPRRFAGRQIAKWRRTEPEHA